MTVAYLRVDDVNESWALIGPSSNPDEAWQWAKEINKALKGSDEPCYGCHCGVVQVGQQVGDIGTIKEMLHTSTHTMTVLI